MALLADVLWWTIAVPVVAVAGWWTLLSIMALPRPRSIVPAPRRARRFAIVIPAHNEERDIAACIESLLTAASATLPEVLVVADNCDDATAFVAARAGASVLVRDDPSIRGKGYALRLAIEHLASRPQVPDVVVFIDADTTATPNLLMAIADRLESGANAVQVYYEPHASGSASALLRLRRLAFRLVHWARPLGAARLGLGAGLKGNGMAMTWDVAQGAVGAAGLAEDAEMTLALARSGVPVTFEPRATVTGLMAADYGRARVQDERWERGRLGLVAAALRVAWHAARRRRLACAYAALEVAMPPLSLAALLAVALAGASLAGIGNVALGAAGLALVAAYVTIGLVAARAPLADVRALIWAPRFLAHKAAIFFTVTARRRATSWQRTARE